VDLKIVVCVLPMLLIYNNISKNMKECKLKRIHKEHRNSWISSFEILFFLYSLHYTYIQPSSSSLIFKFYNAAYAFNSSSSLAGPSFYIIISTPFMASTYYNTSSGYPPGISKFMGGLNLLFSLLPESTQIWCFSTILFFQLVCWDSLL